MTTEERDEWRIKRLTKKISLTKIAKSIGCTPQLLSMFESGNYLAEDKLQAYMEYITNN